MDLPTRDTLNKTNFKEKANLLYLRELIEETLEMVRWRVREYLNSKMDQYMMESIGTIESMELENILKMERLMKGIGKMV